MGLAQAHPNEDMTDCFTHVQGEDYLRILLFTGQFLETINISYSGHLNNRTAVNLIYIRLVPRPKEEVKGPGFSHSNMLFLISDLSRCLSVGGCQ